MFVTESADCIPVTESQSQRLVREWCELAGLDSADCFPLDRDDAGEVLNVGGGYAVDGAELRRLGAMGQVPDCEQYDAKDLLAAACALEARRQWRPDGVHAAKIHPQMLLLENVLADGDAGLDLLREQFKRFDLRFALVLLVEADARELREKCLSTVHALLALEGVRV